MSLILGLSEAVVVVVTHFLDCPHVLIYSWNRQWAGSASIRADTWSHLLWETQVFSQLLMTCPQRLAKFPFHVVQLSRSTPPLPDSAVYYLYRLFGLRMVTASLISCLVHTNSRCRSLTVPGHVECFPRKKVFFHVNKEFEHLRVDHSFPPLEPQPSDGEFEFQTFALMYWYSLIDRIKFHPHSKN